jgi:Asp-tRNA(Asn)/Glu-tRNA(Gln) amidotransferase A subunit family amidase
LNGDHRLDVVEAQGEHPSATSERVHLGKNIKPDSAANFATFTLGEDSWGSLLIPANANSAATLRPSIGLVSRDRVMPIVGAHDTAGPMARNITDLALVMDAIAATDKADPVTIAAATAERDFARKLSADDEAINATMTTATARTTNLSASS